MSRRLRLVGKQLGLAVHGAFGQSGDLVLEELLSLLPDADVLPVLEAEQTGQQVGAESLRCLARKQAGQVVDADHAQGQTVAAFGQRDGHCGLGEGGVDVVDWDGVVGVGGVARDIADNAQATRVGGQRLGVDEGRDLGGEVDAVDENVRLDNLLVGTRLGRGLGKIPLEDVLKTSADAEVDGTTTAAAESTNDEDARVVASLGLALFDGLLDVVNEEVLILVAGDGRKRLILAVLELPGPSQESEGGTSEASVVAKCCNTAAVLILEELKVKKSSITLGETAEDSVPSTLALVACIWSVMRFEDNHKTSKMERTVSELHVLLTRSAITVKVEIINATNSVLQREVLLRQFLKTNDNVITRSLRPRTSRDERCTSALVLGIWEDAQWRSLDIDCVASIDQLLSDRRRDSRTVLKGLGLCSDVKNS